MPLLKTYETYETERAARTSDGHLSDNKRRSQTLRTVAIYLTSILGSLILLYRYIIFYYYLFLCIGVYNPPGTPREWSEFKNQTFAVGFDLTAGYGYDLSF
jgi:hypothetical protein